MIPKEKNQQGIFVTNRQVKREVTIIFTVSSGERAHTLSILNKRKNKNCNTRAVIFKCMT